MNNTIYFQGLPVIGITNYRKSPIMKWVDIAIVTAIQHNVFAGSEGLTRITEVAVFDLLFYLLFNADKKHNSEFINRTEFDQSQYSL